MSNICMRNLDEGMFFLFGMGSLYIFVNIFKIIDTKLTILSDKIQKSNDIELYTTEEKDTQTENYGEIEIIETSEEVPKIKKSFWVW